MNAGRSSASHQAERRDEGETADCESGTHAAVNERPVPPPADLTAPELYVNRELSWLEFNARIVAEAASPNVPLFERVKFLGIFSTNLDEFFMVRVAGVQAQESKRGDDLAPDGMPPSAQLDAIARRCRELTKEARRVWLNQLEPELRRAGIAVVRPESLDEKRLAKLDQHFNEAIYPVLTPIAIDPVHPFPHVRNKSINIGVTLRRQGLSHRPGFGVVQVPLTLPRLLKVEVAGLDRAFVLMEDLIQRHMERIFPDMGVESQFAFRVTRDFDIQIDDDEGSDLVRTMQTELRRRERGDAVRLEISESAADTSVEWLCRELDLQRERDAYRVRGPLFLGDLVSLVAGIERPGCRDEAFAPVYVAPLRDSEDFFATIREGDVLLHHPYESFEAVADFLAQAAEDPAVLAIKMTLYRSGGESPLVRALQRAAESGKQVTALVELKARFDEESNIRWARMLERSGVNVMYGLVGLKLHAKVLLVVRREGAGLRRYVHLATGNYHHETARLYEDVSLFTAREDFGEDATALFNLLTGYSTPPSWHRFIVAPIALHETVLRLIQRETAHARAGRPSGIVAKMNSLVEPEVIRALYEASQAGVPIELLVRGICCLRPGVPGVSETISVRAVIDRFLEHARMFRFENGGTAELFCASADWMPRNFRRRVEVMFPIVDAALATRLTQMLQVMRADNVKAWNGLPDGSYVRVERGPTDVPVRSQARFIGLARELARDPVRLRLSEHPTPSALRRRSSFSQGEIVRQKQKKKHRRDL